MSNITPREVSSAKMATRVNTNAVVSHFPYDNTFAFDQANTSYDYAAFRGEVEPRTIESVQMRGR